MGMCQQVEGNLRNRPGIHNKLQPCGAYNATATEHVTSQFPIHDIYKKQPTPPGTICTEHSLRPNGTVTLEVFSDTHHTLNIVVVLCTTTCAPGFGTVSTMLLNACAVGMCQQVGENLRSRPRINSKLQPCGEDHIHKSWNFFHMLSLR